MPIDALEVSYYAEIEVNVFDGCKVGTTICRAGKPDGNPEEFWVEFDPYGNVNADEITHWQPLPAPPKQ